MKLDISNVWDSAKDGLKEVAETAQETTSAFHENYVSKVLPDCGKYGDEAKFVAEMIPGVSEYNAIKDGDWMAFAIAAGIDIAAIAAGAFTAGAGYAAVKSGGTVAKAGVRAAAKELAEAGAKAVVKETVETGVKKAIKQTVETGVEKVVKETVESGVETAVREVAEAGAKKAVKEAVETTVRETTESAVKKTVKETTETAVEKTVKETVETGAETAVRETAEAGVEKAVKEVSEEVATEVAEDAVESLDELAQVVINKRDGTAREEKVLEELVSKYGKDNVIRESLLRNKDGIPIKDPETNHARKIDFIVTQGKKIIESIEVTSETADKTLQMAQQIRVLEEAAKYGGAFIKDKSGDLIEFPIDIITEIRRLK